MPRTFKHSWINTLLAGMLALVFVPLSGPLFFCKCEGQVITISQLQSDEECCAEKCEVAPVATEEKDCCAGDLDMPCNEELALAFATPGSAGAHLDGVDLPLPSNVAVPGEHHSDLTVLGIFSPKLESLDSHPPPGSGRLHLHFQILLI